MKEITSVIRPDKWSATHAALIAIGAENVMERRLRGLGHQRSLRRSSGKGDIAYLPPRMVVCRVPDSILPDAIEAIFQANRTGNVGDGNIFVRSIAHVEVTPNEMALAAAIGA